MKIRSHRICLYGYTVLGLPNKIPERQNVIIRVTHTSHSSLSCTTIYHYNNPIQLSRYKNPIPTAHTHISIKKNLKYRRAYTRTRRIYTHRSNITIRSLPSPLSSQSIFLSLSLSSSTYLNKHVYRDTQLARARNRWQSQCCCSLSSQSGAKFKRATGPSPPLAIER